MRAGDELVRGEPIRILIGARVDLVPGELLGRHVARRPQDLALLRAEAHRRDGLGEPEIEHLDDPVVDDHDVRRLHVAVDDARLVGGRGRARHVDEPGELSRRRHAVVPHVGQQRHAGDEHHHDVEDALRLADVVDGDGVRVGEPSRGAGLAEEPGDCLVVPAIGAKHLERDPISDSIS